MKSSDRKQGIDDIRHQTRAKILDAVCADPRFVGCVDYGSAGEGRDDAWSDLDLAFFVRDESLEEVHRNWKVWASQFGNPLLMFLGALDHPWVVYDAKPLPFRADFAFHAASNLKVVLDWPNAPVSVEDMVLYDDTGGQLSQTVGRIVGQNLSPVDLQETFEKVCGAFWYYLLRIEGRIQRGELWSAAWQFNYIVMAHLCALLKVQHGALNRFRSTDSMAGIERVITPTEQARLNRCVAKPDVDHLRQVLVEATQLGREVCVTISEKNGWGWPHHLAQRIFELNCQELNNQPVIELYDGVAERYDQSVADTRYVVPSWLEEQLKSMSLSADFRYLDLGCGNGINAKVLHQQFPYSVGVGLDIAPKMVEAARQTGLYERVEVHDIGVPFEFLTSNSFDVVLAFGCMEFVPSPQTCLREICRVLRRGGEWLLSFQLYVVCRSDAPRLMRSGAVIHHAYSETEVKRMLREANLALTDLEERVGYEGGFPCPYLMAMGRKK